MRTGALRLGAAAALYAVALAGAVGVACSAPGLSCHLAAGANPATAAVLLAAGSFAIGLLAMGLVFTPAAMLLRSIGWLYAWSAALSAVLAAILPAILLCNAAGGSCSSRSIAPLLGSLLFASSCGSVFLWLSWLRPQASRPGLRERLSAQPRAVKAGLAFLAGYLALVAAAAVFVASSGGDMSGLVFVFIALPWPLLGSWLFGDGGMMAGALLGLALNGAISFGIGYVIRSTDGG